MTIAIDSPKAIAEPASPDGEELRPIVPYIGKDAQGGPALIGSKCGGCGEILIGRPAVCIRCGARGGMEEITLGKSGTLYNYTTVHRCLPGVPVPFVFAIVDLDGGGTVKGNLVADDADIAYDMRVRLVFETAAQTDAKGRSYLTYHFVKA